MMMTNWITTTIKQLLCRHDWIRHGDRMVRTSHYIVPKARFICRKCGKEILR